MERLSYKSAMTKKELERQRQQEIDSAWGGMSLDQAINSSPIKRSIPSNLDPNPERNKKNIQSIRMSNRSDVNNSDTMDQPVRIIGSSHYNLGTFDGRNMFEDEIDQYMGATNQQYDDFDEEDNDENYWNEMYNNFNQRHTNTRPAFPRSTASNSSNIRSDDIISQDIRPIALNPTGRYNLNFIDWNNEWERAHEAMDQDDPDDYYIQGILNRDIEALYNALGDHEEEKQGVKEDIMKKLKIVKITNTKQYEKDDTCPICLTNYAIGHKIVKLKCNHSFHADCVKKWFEKSSSCPKCRADMNKTTKPKAK